MIRRRKLLLLLLLVSFVALAGWLVYHETRTPQNEREVLNRMIELEKEGRYDKAVQVVQDWMHDRRHDSSHDELLYQQIAMVYIAKAQNTRDSKDESIHLAEMNLEKSLDLFDKEEPKDNDPWLFEIGGGYELLGDRSGKEKCRLYERAHELLARQLPLIKGDSYTAYGHTTPLEPVRADVRKHLAAIADKAAQVGCPGSRGK